MYVSVILYGVLLGGVDGVVLYCMVVFVWGGACVFCVLDFVSAEWGPPLARRELPWFGKGTTLG